MSAVLLLLWLWWGLLGFLSVVLAVLWFYGSLGKMGKFVFLVLVGTGLQVLIVRHIGADERCANGFLTAWYAASADYPAGRAETEEMPSFMDFERIRNYDGNFPDRFRLLRRSPVHTAGRETILTDRDPKPVQTKVFLSDVRMHGGEQDMDYAAKIRVWVATDSHEVAKFQFEEIRFE